MSLQHFFLQKQVLSDEQEEVFDLDLDGDDLKHFQVLRLRAGEHIAVIDAEGCYFECEITSVSKAFVTVRIARREEKPADWPQVILVQGVPKGDKMGDIIRHGTELGIDGFIPFVCERSIVKMDNNKAATKTERWQAIARSAAMQSGQRRIPEVYEPCKPEDIGTILGDVSALLVCWEENEGQGISHTLNSVLSQKETPLDQTRIAVVVGPEGGLTADEVQIFLQSSPNAFEVSLGPSILRTETAGVVAPALILNELGRLQ